MINYINTGADIQQQKQKKNEIGTNSGWQHTKSSTKP